MTNYLVVGAGLFGAVFAHEAAQRGHKVKVIEKRDHVAGNIYTKEVHGIQVHQFGAHIFHTSKKEIWEYVNQFAEFNRYTNSPVANYNGEIYNLPFNMNTFNKLWGVATPKEAMAKIEEQRAVLNGKKPENLEEQAISLIGTDIYEKLIKGYTEKQWGRKATELPAFIIRRLPVRLTYDNNYFNDTYQGIPIGGYTQIVEKMLDHDNITVETGVDFLDRKEEYLKEYDKVVFTGMIDQFFDYKLGELEYRSLRFETEVLDEDNHQGNAVVNYTDAETPYTRIIEHKHFEFGKGEKGKTEKNDEKIAFNIKTGARLLTIDQKHEIEKIVDNYPNFLVHRIVSDVINTKEALQIMDSKNVHVNGDVIRNGQVKDITGDVLFLGNLHQGGILRATGNIYVMGSVSGIIHAGFDSNVRSIILGDISGAQQLRIGDLVDIVDEEKVTVGTDSLVFVNDLHVLEFTSIDKLKSLRPKIFNQVGGF